MANRFLSNITINDSYTFPSADGDAGQIITTDGSGNLSFTDISNLAGAQSNFVYYDVKNSSGATINKGAAVMAVGTEGNSGHILIDEMVADGSIEPKYFMGVLESTLANGAIGRVIHFGELDQFNTNDFNDGDILWCDPATPGGFTVVEPDGPNVKIAAAIVINASTNGKIKVRVQGNPGLHELHDVLANPVSTADGDLLQWTATPGVWTNRSLADIADSRYVNVSGDTMTGTLSIIKNNVGVPTYSGNYSDFIIEATDAHVDLISSGDGSWGSAINFVEGTDSTANTDVWSIARQTTGDAGDSSLNFNFGTTNVHNNTTRVKFTEDWSYFNGKVAIGQTTEPSETLLVAGSARINGNLNVFEYVRIDRSSNELALVLEDSGGDDTGFLTVNDGQGNMALMLGVDGAGKHVVTDDGAAKVLYSAHGQDGIVSLNAAKTGTAGNAVNFSIGLAVNANDNTIKVGNPNDDNGLDNTDGYTVFNANGDLFTTKINARTGTEVLFNDTLRIDAAGVPQLILDGGSDTTGDIVVPDGEILQVGHWDSTTSTYTDRLRITSTGEVSISGNLDGSTGSFSGDITFDNGQGIVSSNGAHLKTGAGGNTFTAKGGGASSDAFNVVDSSDNMQFSVDAGGDGWSYFAGDLAVNQTTQPTHKLEVNGSAEIKGSLYLNAADSLGFEGGNHWITYNDGAGNFNIRVGHYDNSSGVEECTEDGYIFHDEWSQGSGWRQFNVSAVSMTAGQLIGTDTNWRTQIEYDADNVYLRYGGSLRLTTTSDGVTISGDLTADSFVGDGSQITGLTIDLQDVTDNGNTTTNGITVANMLISSTAPLLDFVDTNSFTDANDRFRIRAAGNVGQIRWLDDSESTDTVLVTFNPNGDVNILGEITSNGNRVLTTADEGPENGLDADTLDTLDSAQFLRSDVDDDVDGDLTFNGTATFNSGPIINGVSNAMYLDRDASERNVMIFRDQGVEQWDLWMRDGGELEWVSDVNGLFTVASDFRAEGDATITGKIVLGSTSDSDFLTGSSKMSVDGYIMVNGIVNTSETGTGPAAIVFGDGDTYGSDQISFVTTGLKRLDIGSGGDTNIYQDLKVSGNTSLGKTSAATYSLEVYDATSNVVAQFESGDNQAWISVKDDDSGTYGALFGCDADNNQNIILAGSDATKRFIIDNDGFASIINNAGSSNASLTFSNDDTGIALDQSIGYINFYSNDASTTSSGGVGGIALKAEEAFDTSYTPTYLAFYTHERTANDGTLLGNVIERMRITSEGKLRLTSNQGNWTNGDIISENQTYITDGSGIGARVVTSIKSVTENTGVTTSGALVFETSEYNSNVSESLRITSGGNVNISRGNVNISSGNLDLASNGSVNNINSILFANTERSDTYYTDDSGRLAFDENFYADDEYGTGSYNPAAVWSTNGGGLVVKNEDGWGGVFTSVNSQWATPYWEGLRVSDGVSIGHTATPAYKLDVRSSGNLFYGQTDLNDTTSVFRLRGDGGSTDLFEVWADGSVGIGTSSPGSKLEVAGNIQSQYDSSNYSRIGQNSLGGYIQAYSGGSENIMFRSYGDSHIANNLGIGTTSPDSKLDVTATGAHGIVLNRDEGTPANSGRLFFLSADGNIGLFANAGRLDFRTGSVPGSTSGNRKMTLTQAGDLLIGTGTSPQGKLDVDGQIVLSGDTEHYIEKDTTSLVTGSAVETTTISGRNVDLYAFDDVNLRAGSGDNITMHSGGGERVRITNTGSVGIGTTSPSYRVEINNNDLNTDDAALYVRNNNGATTAVIAQFVGDSDAIQIKNIGSGDYQIRNTQQDNAVDFYDGTGGVAIRYNGSIVLRAYSTGGVDITGDMKATGDVIAYSSDERLKENVKPIENAIDKLMQIKGVTFDWKDEIDELGFEPRNRKNDVGVIAQDVEKVLPQLIAPAPFDADIDEEGNRISKSGKDYVTVQYDRLNALLIEAIKEQQKQIDELKNIIKNK